MFLDCDKMWLVEEAKEVSQSPCAKPSEFISRPLLFDKNVQTVSCGKEHSLILTAEGKVYSFGNGRYCSELYSSNVISTVVK